MKNKSIYDKMKQKFKIGDKVWALKNHVWGLEPMTIVYLYDDGSVKCKSVTMGMGAFPSEELTKNPSKARLKKIELYKKIRNKLLPKLQEELF